jgi:hypothetical protein
MNPSSFCGFTTMALVPSFLPPQHPIWSLLLLAASKTAIMWLPGHIELLLCLVMSSATHLQLTAKLPMKILSLLFNPCHDADQLSV